MSGLSAYAKAFVFLILALVLRLATQCAIRIVRIYYISISEHTVSMPWSCTVPRVAGRKGWDASLLAQDNPVMGY